jgi:protein-L-isoaspartate(D-aspartate) O-methyltransferase
MFDELGLSPGERVLHLGCGTGYYTAVMAELVGLNGTITAVEIDERLARRAHEALSDRLGVSVTVGDGLQVDPAVYDAIVVSAGATHPLEPWLDGLRPGGRLLFPLTMEPQPSRRGAGAMLLITRAEHELFAARFLSPAAFIHLRGARDAQSNEKLLDAFRKRFRHLSEVRSFRRDGHQADDSCWLHGNNFCLSYRETDKVRAMTPEE